MTVPVDKSFTSSLLIGCDTHGETLVGPSLLTYCLYERK